MPKIDVRNFIPYFVGRASSSESLRSLTPQHAAERVRGACQEQGRDFAEWSRLIVMNCIIPAGHPYRALLARHRVPTGDPLWTLGAIAYGTQNSWIVLERIRWDDGTEDFPQRQEREWIPASGRRLAV